MIIKQVIHNTFIKGGQTSNRKVGVTPARKYAIFKIKITSI